MKLRLFLFVLPTVLLLAQTRTIGPNLSELLINTTTFDGSSKLQVNGAFTVAHPGPIRIAQSNGTVAPAAIRLAADGSNNGIVDATTGALSLQVGAGTKLHIPANTGNVLIGTTTDDTVSKLQVNGRIAAPLTTPASSTATCTGGQIVWDADYVYVCTSANNWKRSALSTF